MMRVSVKVHGVSYTLQHPGVRAYLRAKPSLLHWVVAKDMQGDSCHVADFHEERLLDYCFGLSASDSKIVIPQDKPFICWQSIPIEQIEQTWLPLLRGFLRGLYPDIPSVVWSDPLSADVSSTQISSAYSKS